MEVHHRCDIEIISVQSVNDCVRKPVEVKLPIISPDLAPTSRLRHDAVQRAFELIQEIIPQAWQPFLIPQHCSLQFLLGFRMADDAHAACGECPEPPGLLDGN